VIGGMRLQRQIGPSHAAERIGLTDQAREFCQRIAITLGRRVLISAVIGVIIGGERFLLISISQRDDASPSGKPPTRFLLANQPLPDALTNPRERRSPLD